MTNDSDTPSRQSNSTPNTTTADRDQQWIDTIDDWDAVLDGEDPAKERTAANESPTSEASSTADESTTSKSPPSPSETKTKPSWETDTANSRRPTGFGVDEPTETASERTDRSDTSSGSSSSADGDTKSTQTDGGSAFVRIDPISDPLLKSAAHVLPEPWLADTDVQQLIQWVVYTYVDETDPALSTAARVETAIDRAADETDTSPKTIQQLCTNSLYRGHSGTPVENFYSDLETIHRRLSETPVATAD